MWTVYEVDIECSGELNFYVSKKTYTSQYGRAWKLPLPHCTQN